MAFLLRYMLHDLYLTHDFILSSNFDLDVSRSHYTIYMDRLVLRIHVYDYGYMYMDRL